MYITPWSNLGSYCFYVEQIGRSELRLTLTFRLEIVVVFAVLLNISPVWDYD